MKKFRITWATVILWALLNTTAYATSILDWSTVTLSGTFPNFSFSHSTLGNVSLSYSNDTEFFGVGDYLAVPTLILGNTGGESLTMSWSNPATNLNMEIWDIDAIPTTSGEAVTFVTSATASIVALHPTDVWSPTTQTLSSDGTPNPNTQLDNFTVINFANPTGFESITFNWDVVGTGIMGIGELSALQPVPEPSTLLLLGSGLVGLAGFRKKFKVKTS